MSITDIIFHSKCNTYQFYKVDMRIVLAGIEKDYKCKKVIMKDKKQKQKELTRSQKLNNKKKI
ncbi:MAG: hypothetical protein KatS3mg068_0668 [Candidatus Sericytochromatia bacterium]|nr:MAG: hypothetical protein KatS3mg068_0668 [Candidatus Sericytochromatia bacterium]